MDKDNNFWGEEWRETRKELEQVGAVSGADKYTKDEGVFLALQVLHQKNPDLFRKVKIEIVTPKDDEPLSRTPGFFHIDEKKDADGHDLLVPTIMVSEMASKIDRERRKISIEQMAAKFGLRAEDLSDRFLRVFIFFHEVGHAQDYTTNYLEYDTPEHATNKWSDVYNKELRTLPLPGIMPSVAASCYNNSFGEPEAFLQHMIAHLQKYRPDFIKDYQDFSDQFRKKLESTTIGQLMVENEKAYRAMPSEAYADNFAADFIKQHHKELNLKELDK